MAVYQHLFYWCDSHMRLHEWYQLTLLQLQARDSSWHTYQYSVQWIHCELPNSGLTSVSGVVFPKQRWNDFKPILELLPKSLCVPASCFPNLSSNICREQWTLWLRNIAKTEPVGKAEQISTSGHRLAQLISLEVMELCAINKQGRRFSLALNKF